MTDHDLLVSLFEFLKARDFVLGNEGSVRDMVNRYARPPLTMHYRCAMQLTVRDYKDLALLLSQIDAHLKQTDATGGEPIYLRNTLTGELDLAGTTTKNESA